MSEVAYRLAAINTIITKTATDAGHQPEDVKLVAVTKTHPPEIIREAIDEGPASLRRKPLAGRPAAKIPLLPPKARWHLIGHLQKNKIRVALPLFELIHGVDSLELARDMDRIAAGTRACSPRSCSRVNVAGESTKVSFKPAGNSPRHGGPCLRWKPWVQRRTDDHRPDRGARRKKRGSTAELRAN